MRERWEIKAIFDRLCKLWLVWLTTRCHMRGCDYLLCPPPVWPACCYSRCDAENWERHRPRYLPVWNTDATCISPSLRSASLRAAYFRWRKIFCDFNSIFRHVRYSKTTRTNHFNTWIKIHFDKSHFTVISRHAEKNVRISAWLRLGLTRNGLT